MYTFIALALIVFAAQGSDAVACEFTQDNFHLQYGLLRGNVHFRLIITGVTPRYSSWNAVAFGTGMWSGLDVITVRVINGRATISDEYVQGFTAPYPDASSDVVVDQVSYIDNMIVMSFHRPAFTRDTRYDAQLSGCQTWKFATGTNPISPRGEIFHHRRTPVGRMVCIEQCRI